MIIWCREERLSWMRIEYALCASFFNRMAPDTVHPVANGHRIAVFF